ncbi:MAG: Asd/ArgC dimerization domain-containing protein [Gallionellaceae bacterium]|nr:Asd/ArgC dimerization domain-containing protein [Gallionellaceae bacterium]
MTKRLNIALLGADDPVGEAALRLLSERDIEVGEVFPLTLSESEGCVTVRGEEMPLLEVSGFDWAQADILVNATRSIAAGRLEAVAAQAGCRVIGFGRGDGTTARIALEGAVSIALHRVLAPILRDTPLESLVVTAMLPVAAAGEAGVAELAAQTRALFSMESLAPEAFPLQIAFNLIPQVGLMQADGCSRLEQDVALEIRTMLGCPELPVSVTAMWAPLFYGTAVTVHARVQDRADVEGLRKRLAGHDGITMMDTALPGGVATPATDAQDSDAVFVSRFRPGADPGRDLAMWLVIDLIRLEASRIMDCLENLIEK